MTPLPRVLVADDDAVVRTIFRTALESWRYPAELVATGTDALERLLAPDRPSIAILDWEMPGMTGIAVCREVRKRVPVADRPCMIVLTARESDDAPAIALDAGADDFVRKPIHAAEVRTRLHIAASMRELRRVAGEHSRLEGAMEMASTVCHELNQPLQAARVNLELVRMERGDDPAIAEELEQVHRQIVRLGALTSRLMRLTHYRPAAYLDRDTRILDLSPPDVVPDPRPHVAEAPDSAPITDSPSRAVS